MGAAELLDAQLDEEDAMPAEPDVDVHGDWTVEPYDPDRDDPPADHHAQGDDPADVD